MTSNFQEKETDLETSRKSRPFSVPENHSSQPSTCTTDKIVMPRDPFFNGNIFMPKHSYSKEISRDSTWVQQHYDCKQTRSEIVKMVTPEEVCHNKYVKRSVRDQERKRTYKRNKKSQKVKVKKESGL